MASIPEKHTSIPKIYRNKPLIEKYRYFNDSGEFIGYAAYYGERSQIGESDNVLFFAYEDGEWKPEVDRHIIKLPLYRLRKLQSRPSSERVVIVENDRSAKALTQISKPPKHSKYSPINVCAVSPAQGTKFVEETDWSPLNGIKCVYLVTSNDRIGIEFTEDVYMQLTLLPSPPQLRIVTLPDLAENDDLVDWLESFPLLWRNDQPVRDFSKSVLALNIKSMGNLLASIFNDLLNEAIVFSMDKEDVIEQTKDDWSAPKSLVSEPLPVLAMTKKMLPRAMRSFLVNAIPEAPLDYIAVSAIIVAGSLIGSACGMCPKKLSESWIELPSLWGALIGGPGMYKTPAMDQVILLLERLQNEYTKKYKDKEHSHEYKEIQHKAKLDVIIKQIKKLALENQDETTAASNVSLKREYIRVARTKPVHTRRSFMTNETSVQGMTKVQAANPRGILLNRDELSGLLVEWYGKHASDRSYYLSGWNRQVSYREDKIGRGVTEADIIFISLLGTIQPEMLGVYLNKADQGLNDGLMQRFQLSVYPDAPTPVSEESKPVDRKLDDNEIERVYSIFQTLAEMDFLECGAITNTFAKQPFFHFDEEGQQIYNDWSDSYVNKITNEPNKHMKMHLLKYQKLFASLALIFHCIELADNYEYSGEVGAYPAKLAVKWCEYLETHARRIYAIADDIYADQTVIKLSKMIKEKQAPNFFKAREIYGLHRTGLKIAKDVHAACGVLVEANWLKIQEPVKGGGRPELVRYAINPVFL